MSVGWDWAAPAPSQRFQVLDFPLEKLLLFVPGLNEPLTVEMSNSKFLTFPMEKNFQGCTRSGGRDGKHPQGQGWDWLGFGISPKSRNSYKTQP